MAETINHEDRQRDELNTLAVEAGLTDAAKYVNKVPLPMQSTGSAMVKTLQP
jgi:hypothetical protein